ncbi:4'-phosphopantetheinyl transferase family protein [Viridibacillus sp. NPDC096237]|uniref:4'-phosphopantetheinyl transferase family protein n=1 Tax=Viridibacillus sp. NPDC096237 TaxID=3390721 RepID=UPI003D012FAD
MRLFVKNWTSSNLGVCAQYYYELPAFQKIEVDKFKRKEDRIRAIFSRRLLNEFLQRHDFEHGQLAVSEYGKKYIKNGAVYFNISHSGRYIVLVEYDREIGVDIEQISAYDEKIAQLCFTPYENLVLKETPASKRDDLFTCIWTRKESYVKNLGLGLTCEAFLRAIETLENEGIVYNMYDFHELACLSQKSDGHIMSVCV